MSAHQSILKPKPILVRVVELGHHLTLFVSSLLFYGTVANAQAATAPTEAQSKATRSPTSPSDSGFNPIDSSACAPQAAIARRSVIRMVLPIHEGNSVRDLLGTDGPDVRKKLIEVIREDTSRPPTTNDISIWELENCINSRSADCQLSTAYRSSTVVLTGDGTESATAFHNLKMILMPFLKAAKGTGRSARETAELINGIPIPAFFYNFEGALIGQPQDVLVRPNRVTADHITEAWRDLDDKDMPPFADGAALRFSRSLGPGVRVARRAPTFGDQTKLFGFPDVTEAWRAIGANDSDGHSMYCSTGVAISPEMAAKRFKWSFDSLPEADKDRYRATTVFTSSASFSGMSGGAVFNEAGELVATHSSGNNVPADQSTANTKIPGVE